MRPYVHPDRISIAALFALAFALSACGSDDRSERSATAGQDGAAGGGQDAGGVRTGGAGGTGGTGGKDGGGGTGGVSGGAGIGATGGGATSGAEGAAGTDGAAVEYPRDGAIYDGTLGPIGTIPIGSLCANDQNCSQDQGPAVCCVNTCLLAEDCPGGNYLRCVTGSDCEAFGGGKVCCDVPGMRFCTKPSACEGEVIR
jgi:hypothetical protein